MKAQEPAKVALGLAIRSLAVLALSVLARVIVLGDVWTELVAYVPLACFGSLNALYIAGQAAGMVRRSREATAMSRIGMAKGNVESGPGIEPKRHRQGSGLVELATIALIFACAPATVEFIWLQMPLTEERLSTHLLLGLMFASASQLVTAVAMVVGLRLVPSTVVHVDRSDDAD